MSTPTISTERLLDLAKSTATAAVYYAKYYAKYDANVACRDFVAGLIGAVRVRDPEAADAIAIALRMPHLTAEALELRFHGTNTTPGE